MSFHSSKSIEMGTKNRKFDKLIRLRCKNYNRYRKKCNYNLKNPIILINYIILFKKCKIMIL